MVQQPKFVLFFIVRRARRVDVNRTPAVKSSSSWPGDSEGKKIVDKLEQEASGLTFEGERNGCERL